MLLIRWFHPMQVNAKRSQAATCTHSIGHSQSGIGSDKTGRKHSDSDSQIKRSQISRGCRSAHIMRSDIDKETLESRDSHTVADADHQGAGKENPRLMDGCKHGKRHQQADRRTDRRRGGGYREVETRFETRQTDYRLRDRNIRTPDQFHESRP